MIKTPKNHSYNIKTNDRLGLQDLNIQMIKTPKSLATMSRPTTDLVLQSPVFSPQLQYQDQRQTWSYKVWWSRPKYTNDQDPQKSSYNIKTSDRLGLTKSRICTAARPSSLCWMTINAKRYKWSRPSKIIATIWKPTTDLVLQSMTIKTKIYKWSRPPKI